MAPTTASTTATATRMHVRPDQTGLWHVRQSQEAADVTSRLLQADLEQHHVFFNSSGFHNHIPHHLLSLFGTGAPADALQAAYDHNQGYQQPAKQVHARDNERSEEKEEKEEKDWYGGLGVALGQQAYYPDFLCFFQQQIERHGGDYRPVVAERLLAGTAAADDLLVRLCSGFVHPLLQLQFGLEWDQPAVVAQALAQACVHRPQGLDAYLLQAEKAEKQQATAADDSADMSDTPTIRALCQALAADPVLASAARPGDANKLRDGVLARARDALVALAARVRVPPTAAAVAARTAEMAETSVFLAAAAALRPPKHVKFDFFLMHQVTSLPFFFVVADADWVPLAAKARLLAWKIRLDLAQYAARACPPLEAGLDGIAAYRGGEQAVSEPGAVSVPRLSAAASHAAARLFRFPDDGHAIKLVRATALAEQACRPYKDAPWRILRSDRLWAQIYRMQVDAVTGPGPEWVRTAGLEEAWEDVEDGPNGQP